MKLYRTISRYYFIINKIKESNFPSFKDVQESLTEQDFSISRRTLQRDIENIRMEFGIEIEYNNSKKGYCILINESFEFDYYNRFFEMAMMSGTFVDVIKDRKNIKQIISFDSNENLLGMEFLNKIIFAIQKHNVVVIKYKPFERETASDEKIAPLFLKEYQKRWYVVSMLLRKNEIRTYSLDRIKEIQLTDEKYIERNLNKIQEKFDNIIGIGFHENPPQVIELSFTPEQGKYIETQKLHFTQKVITDNNDEYRIQIYVGRNYELEQKIISFSDQVKVIKPQWLKDILIERAQKFLNKNL